MREIDQSVTVARKRPWSWPIIALFALAAAPCGIVALVCFIIAEDDKLNLRGRLAERIAAAADARAAHRLDSSASLGEEDQGLLLLKVAAAVLVCTMVSMGRFAGYYTGEATETWSDLASAVLARLPALNFSFRVAFAWPSRLAWDVQSAGCGHQRVQRAVLAARVPQGLDGWRPRNVGRGRVCCGP